MGAFGEGLKASFVTIMTELMTIIISMSRQRLLPCCVFAVDYNSMFFLSHGYPTLIKQQKNVLSTGNHCH